MIKLLDAEKSADGQLFMTVLVDAKAADIKRQAERYEAEQNIGKRLNALSIAISNRIDSGFVEQEFREYLREHLFKHFVDVVSINDFIYDAREVFKCYRDNVILAGFRITYKFLNYQGEDNDL